MTNAVPMRISTSGWVFAIWVWLGCLSCHSSSTQPAPTSLTPLQWATDLVSHCSAANTTYQHGKGVVRWKTDTSSYQSYTDCSGFLNALFSQSYHWNEAYFKTWLGVSRPLAFTYYEAIKAGNRFKPISRITDVKPGHIIAIKYIDRAQHDENTGHCLLIAGLPQRIDAKTITLPNTNQYQVLVIDSSESPHGKDDSRITAGGGSYAGLGQGYFRLYADAQGAIVGYSWSIESPGSGYNPLENPIAVGELIP